MSNSTSDLRIDSIVSIQSPRSLLDELPLSTEAATEITASRKRIADILHGRDNRLLVVVGPCSIHDVDAANDYAEKLNALKNQYSDTLEVVMRVYFEKPRSTIGWKGLINDPNIDGSFEIGKGLALARKLLLGLAEMQLPAGCEFLDAVTGQYYADTVSWGAIGARTTESQVHREIASGLSCPVGFKNGTRGNTDIAVDAMQAAGHPHAFLSPDLDGRLSLYRTTGNNDAHLILRGGTEPNYNTQSVAEAFNSQGEAGIKRKIMIDCSHANSGKKHLQQISVIKNIASRLSQECSMIGGLMIESHLVEGKQAPAARESLIYGQSITDACLGWNDTQDVLALLADNHKSCLLYTSPSPRDS